MRKDAAPIRVCLTIVVALFLGGAVDLGSAAAAARPEVVNGSTAQITSFPFIVALYDPAYGPYMGQFCDGVIVDATHVITAAHCLFDNNADQPVLPSGVVVLAGTNDLLGNGVSDPASQTSFDPNWDPATGFDDVGMVTLGSPLWTGATPPALDGADAIAPIPLISAAQVAAGDETSGIVATVSGWGYTQPIGPSDAPSASGYPELLQSGPVDLVSESDCNAAYASVQGSPIAASQLCAGTGASNSPSSCYGDSGGPLVVSPGGDAPADDLLVGLVDLGYGCSEGYPDVYSSVADAGVVSFFDSRPPQAPYMTEGSAPEISTDATPICSPGSWVPDASFSYQFFADETTATDPGAPPQPLTAIGPTATYTVSGGRSRPAHLLRGRGQQRRRIRVRSQRERGSHQPDAEHPRPGRDEPAEHDDDRGAQRGDERDKLVLLHHHHDDLQRLTRRRGAKLVRRSTSRTRPARTRPARST